MLSDSALAMGSCGRIERIVVDETLDKLGEIEKQILYLYYFKSLSQSEIAKRLSIPIGTVKSRLYYAKQSFRKHYPYPPKPDSHKGENIMKCLPEIMPEYSITERKDSPFPVVFEELPNWFIIPKPGETTLWGSYDRPKGKISEKVYSKVTAPIVLHGIEGVEIHTTTENISNDWTDDAQEHIYYAQLTDSHCRWLGENYIDKNGHTVLCRRFNCDEWAFGRYQKTWSEMLPDSEKLSVNGKTYVHWYDCISDYVV